MYHSFKVNSLSQPDAREEELKKRRASSFRACEQCRRRKIRCDGLRPCENCRRSRMDSVCHYLEAGQRPSYTKRSTEQLRQSLKDYQDVFRELLPGVNDPGQLKGLAREKLLDMISKSEVVIQEEPVTSPNNVTTVDQSTPLSEEAEILERFQPMPDDRDQDLDAELQHIADDVNALSLSVDETPSYVGVSSVSAALRVIAWLRPGLFTKVPQDHPSVLGQASFSADSTFDWASQNVGDDVVDPVTSSTAWNEIPLINAYFEYIHPCIPVLEEQAFRTTYLTAQRSDSRWQLLLNSVLAIGSVVAGPVIESSNHWSYFSQASLYLNMETLNHAHFETVQALAILSGYYLHFLQRPTQANALMGAAFRLAVTMGLHKDFTEFVTTAKLQQRQSLLNSVEMRRRLWWSLFMLDSWAGSTLGRPSMGRLGSGITVKLPQEPIGKSPVLLQLVQENIRLSMISTRMEDALAVSPILTEHERQSLDAAYVEWFESSSVQRSNSTTTVPREPHGIGTLRNLMRWRYLWHRVTLHRPYLLWYITRQQSLDRVPLEKQHAVAACYQVCAEMIQDIAETWEGRKKPCQFAGWNATWLIYQASMTPLLSLFCRFSDQACLESSRRQIQVTLATLASLQPWFPTAKRSLEVVSWLYEASLSSQVSAEAATTTGAHLRQGNNTSSTTAIFADLADPPPPFPQPIASLTESGGMGANITSLPAGGGGGEAGSFTLDPSPTTMSNDFFGSLGWSTDWDTAMTDLDIPGIAPIAHPEDSFLTFPEDEEEEEEDDGHAG